MVLIASRNLSSPSAIIFCGVSAILNSARVARLTPASVACADSTTATSRVYGLRCSSSPFGSGLALRKRLKASWISAGVHGSGFTSLFAGDFGVGLAGLFTGFFAAVFLGGLFGKDETLDFLARFARMILAMIRVY